MVMRHYQDTVQIFVNCLMYIQRTRGGQQQQQQQSKTWQYDVVKKLRQIFSFFGHFSASTSHF